VEDGRTPRRQVQCCKEGRGKVLSIAVTSMKRAIGISPEDGTQECLKINLLGLKVVLEKLLDFVLFLFCISSSGYFEQIKTFYSFFIRREYLVPWCISSTVEHSYF
jgi:hypothetical protein